MSRKHQAVRLSVASNTVLVLLKLIAGLFTGSVSILSEAIHSGIDLVAAIIAMLSVRAASQPADAKHRYGHGKIENLSALAEALLIIVAALWIIAEAIQKLRAGHGAPEVSLGLWVMAASVLANWLISGHLIRVAKEEDSMALLADGMHLRTDVWTSLGVFAGLVAVQLTGIAWLDPVAALIVAVMIIKAGWELSWEAIQPLLDAQLPAEEEAAILACIEQHAAGYRSLHDLRTRRSGGERHVDFHLVLPSEAPLAQVHALCDQIERSIQARFPRCAVIIHPEPADEA